MTIGEKIRKFRKEEGLTQKQLAESSGISSVTVQQYETEKRIPKHTNLQKISNALNINILCFDDIQNLVKQQRSLLLSLSVNERLKILRLSAGRTLEELACDIIFFVDNKRSIDCKESQKLAQDIYLVEIGIDDLPEVFATNIAGALGIPKDILLCNNEKSKKQNSSNYPLDDIEFLKEQLINLQQILETMPYSHTNYLEELSPEFQQYYSKLNSEGKQKLLDYAKDLSQLEKYTAPDPNSENEE